MRKLYHYIVSWREMGQEERERISVLYFGPYHLLLNSSVKFTFFLTFQANIYIFICIIIVCLYIFGRNLKYLCISNRLRSKALKTGKK